MVRSKSCGGSLRKTPVFPTGVGGSEPTPPLQFQKTDSELKSPSLWLEEIPLETAAEFVLRHHYSKVMPKQTKIVLGLYKGQNGPLVGVITFGWGVRPQDTIRRLFPSLKAKDYFEIGKMCVHDSEPKNTESRLLSLSMRWIKKNHPQIKLIFTWADAIWGKPGYVYQAANFYYGGFIDTEVYMDKEGRRFHPRQLPAKLRAEGFSKEDIIKKGWGAKNDMGCCRPSKKQLVERGWKHIFGKQFRYAYFLVSDKERNELIQDSAYARTIKYTSTLSKRIFDEEKGEKITKRADIEKTVRKPSIVWRRPIKKGEKVYPKTEDMRWKIDDGKERDGKPSKPIDGPKPEFGEAFDPNRL